MITIFGIMGAILVIAVISGIAYLQYKTNPELFIGFSKN